MRGRGTASIVASPVLVGAVTVLVLMVAVFLAYNANEGLPFVPTRELKVEVSDGSNLVIGNDVREGGFRIGLVSAMKPIELSGGQVGAQLTLKLDKSNGTFPVDSTASVRPRSALGLKFVELTVGTAHKFFADGATLPISQTRQGTGSAGRDHGPAGFSMWMAGGGTKGGTIHGATDDLGHKAVENRVSVHDFHATVLHLLGLNYRDLVFERQGLKERITDQTPARIISENP